MALAKSTEKVFHRSTSINKRPTRILLCGNYGAGNLGDELMLQGAFYALDRIAPNADVTVLAYAAPEAAAGKQHGTLHVSYCWLFPMGIRSIWNGIAKGRLWETLRSYRESDIFILGGGGLLNDEPLFGLLIWSWHVFLARLFGKPILLWGINIGPVRTMVGRWISARVIQVSDLIICRDKTSLRYTEGKGILGTDLLFHFPEADRGKTGKSQDEKTLIVAPRTWAGFSDAMIKKITRLIIDYAEKSPLRVELIDFQRGTMDDRVMNTFIEQLRPRIVVMRKQWQTISDIYDIYRNADGVLGMRLHSILFSIYLGVPFLALAYTDKVWGILQEGMSTRTVRLQDIDTLISIDQCFGVDKNILSQSAKMQKMAEETEKTIRDFVEDHVKL